MYRPGEDDTQGPEITPVSPEAGAVVTNATIPVKVSVEDPGGIAEVTINGRGASLSNDKYEATVSFSGTGTQTITVVARDASPNANVDSLQFEITYDAGAADTDAPDIVLLSHEDGDVVVNASVLVSVEANDPNGIDKVTINGGDALFRNGRYEREVTLPSSGANRVVVKARDASTNRNMDSLTFSLAYDSTASDTVAPEVSCVSHQDGQTVSNDNVPVIVEVSDANGIAGVSINGVAAEQSGGRYQADIALEQGLNTIECRARDASRNANVGTLSLALNYDPTADDNIAPTIKALQPHDGDTVSVTSVLVRVQASDANGIDRVRIAGEEADPVSGGYQRQITLPTSPGEHEITITARDASSKANTASLTLTIVYDPTAEDNTPPVISREAPAAGVVLDEQSVVVKVSASDDNGIKSVTIGGEEASPSGGLYVREITLPDVGVNQVEVTATDNSSHQNVATETFEISWQPTSGDYAPPSISLVSPTTTVTESPVTITVTVTDVNGVAEVLINDQAAARSGSSYSRDLNLSASSHDIRVYALDRSFNANDTTRTFSVTYDPPPPAVSVSIPSSDITPSSMKITWDQSTEGDFESYKVLYGASATSLSEDGSYTTKSTGSHTLSGLDENTRYYVQVVVYDANGSSAGSEIVDAITRFLDPPGIDLVAPSGGETDVVVLPTFDFHVQAGSGKTTTATLSIGTSSSNPKDITVTGLNPASTDADSSYFAYTLATAYQLDNGRRYYWKVQATVTEGDVSKQETSQIRSFYTKNSPPSWGAPSYGAENYRNQTIGFSLFGKATLGVSSSGHELQYSLISGDGSATLVDNSVIWKRNWSMTADTTVRVVAIDTWSQGPMGDTMELTISKRAQPAGTEGMRFVPAKDSTFEMGSNGGESDEQPVHTVSFTYDLWMDTTEVTQKKYDEVMAVYSGYSSPSWTDHGTGDNHPAYNFNWYDAALYCNALSKEAGLDSVYVYSSISGTPGSRSSLNGLVVDLSRTGYRLPTEAEWEYSCRASRRTEYYWGSDSSDFGPYAWNDEDIMHEVGVKLPNEFGLYDMSGNVREWCNDRYNEVYYSVSPISDPEGPESGDYRCMRGGDFGASNLLRSANRGWYYPTDLRGNIGFRVAKRVVF